VNFIDPGKYYWEFQVHKMLGLDEGVVGEALRSGEIKQVRSDRDRLRVKGEWILAWVEEGKADV